MHFLVWILSLATIGAVLARPFGKPEWVWALTGAALLLVAGLIPVPEAAKAVGRGADVYFFLVGMMLLSEQAREEGLFDWVASRAAAGAKGSAFRLFALLYGAGTLVTIFLSNDATAVVLTPAVYQAVKKAGAKPLPYLFACALIANAASFVLPISNPANLVVFQGAVPRLGAWMHHFALPSLLSITVTFGLLGLVFRKDLAQPLSAGESDLTSLSPAGRRTGLGLLGVVAVLLGASALDWDLGLPTFASACLILAYNSWRQGCWPKEAVRSVSWGVIPMVGGLFVVVEALRREGAADFLTKAFATLSQAPGVGGKLAGAFGVGILSNLANNLPVGLLAGQAVRDASVAEPIRHAVLIGVDLGPNLSVTGSLATLLWLMVLRREGERVSGWSFFKVGLVVMPLSLAAAILVS